MGRKGFELTPMELSAVQEMANIGLGHAATALAGLTGRTYAISVPDADAVLLEELPAHMGAQEIQSVGLSMPIGGDTSGFISFILPWTSAQVLWKGLLGTSPEDESEISELHASAMLEVGNILLGSFLAALSDTTGLRMEASPPSMSVDMCASILDSVVCEAEMSHSAVLAVRTSISDLESDVEGFFVFMPNSCGLKTIFHSIGIGAVA